MPSDTVREIQRIVAEEERFYVAVPPTTSSDPNLKAIDEMENKYYTIVTQEPSSNPEIRKMEEALARFYAQTTKVINVPAIPKEAPGALVPQDTYLMLIPPGKAVRVAIR